MFQRLKQRIKEIRHGPALPAGYDQEMNTLLWNYTGSESLRLNYLQGFIHSHSAYALEGPQAPFGPRNAIEPVTTQFIVDIGRIAALDPSEAVRSMAQDMLRSYHASGDFSQTEYSVQSISQERRSRELLQSIDAKFDASNAPPQCQKLDVWYNRVSAFELMGAGTSNVSDAYRVAQEVSRMTHEHPSVISAARKAVQGLEPLLAR